jgi:hypothetical protein
MPLPKVEVPLEQLENMLVIVSAALTPEVVNQSRTLETQQGHPPTEEQMEPIRGAIMNEWMKMHATLRAALECSAAAPSPSAPDQPASPSP